MIAGYPPFYDEDITNTYKKILSGKFSFPPHFSTESRDLIRKLLQVQISTHGHGMSPLLRKKEDFCGFPRDLLYTGCKAAEYMHV